MLSSAEALTIATTWRPKFATQEAFAASVERYLEKIPAPAQNVQSCERWLSEDADQQHVRSALLGPKRTENAPQRLPQPTQCRHCDGHGYVRVDVPVSDARFGKVFKCPDCNGGLRSELIAPVTDTEPRRTGCYQCGNAEDDPAGERCANPRWHLPNADAPPLRGTLGAALERIIRDSRQRCDDCGTWEDEPAPDTCPRSFWHLPDVWLALHPDQTLTDMGSLGPFMRGFLRRQRPGDDA